MINLLFVFGTYSLIFNMIRPFAGISLPDAFFFASFILVIIEGIMKRRSIKVWLPYHPLWFPAFLFLIGGLLSSINAVRGLTSISIAIKQFYTFSLWVSLCIVMVKRGNTRKIITTLIIGALTTAVVALLDYIFNFGIGNFLVITFYPEQNFDFYYRTGGTFGHPNELAMFLAIVFPLTASRYLECSISIGKTKFLRTLYFLTLIIEFLAILASGSLTGLLGVFISSCILLFVFLAKHPLVSKPKILLINISTTICFAMVFWLIIVPFINERGFLDNLIKQNSIYRVSQITGPDRMKLLQEGLDYIQDHPILGAGMDQGGTGGLAVSDLVTSYYIHNTIIQSWVAGGIFVFIGSLLLYILVVIFAVSGIKKYISTKVTSEFIVGLSSSIFGWVIMDMLQANIYQRYKWLVVGLIVGNLLFQKKATSSKKILSDRLSRHYLSANTYPFDSND